MSKGAAAGKKAGESPEAAKKVSPRRGVTGEAGPRRGVVVESLVTGGVGLLCARVSCDRRRRAPACLTDRHVEGKSFR